MCPSPSAKQGESCFSFERPCQVASIDHVDGAIVCGCSSETVIITFDKPVKGVAQGQVAALWDAEGKWCLGSGIIESSTTVE